MKDPAILFVKPKAISSADKKALSDAGVLVIEVADPHDVKLTRPHAELSGSELLGIAADVIANYASTGVRDTFGSKICKAIIAARATE